MTKTIHTAEELQSVDFQTLFLYKPSRVFNEPFGDCYDVGMLVPANLPETAVKGLVRRLDEAAKRTYSSTTMHQIREMGKGYGYQDFVPQVIIKGQNSKTDFKDKKQLLEDSMGVKCNDGNYERLLQGKRLLHVTLPVPEMEKIAQIFADDLEARLQAVVD